MFITIKKKDKIIKDLNENLGLFFTFLLLISYINLGDIMSGICGIVSLNNIRKYKINDLNEMLNKILHRGINKNHYLNQKAMLGQINDKDNNLPLTKYDCIKRYTILLDGELYNNDKIKTQLQDIGYKFKTNDDAEIILNAFIQYKERCLELFKGAFSFVIYDGYQLFMARDKLGLKPLFYTLINDTLFFGSEIKSLFAINTINRKISKDNFIELYSFGPSFNKSSTPFENIYSVEPGEFISFSLRGLRKERYYKIPVKENNFTFEESKNIIKDLLENAVKEQIKGDKVGALLSGGLDSSIICMLLSKYQKINTYCVDYKDNDKNFKANNFQRSRDNDYALMMANYLDTNHHEFKISADSLANNLYNSMIARDKPAMADIDSSLYCFAKYLKQNEDIVFSGECSDEIFGGYPWFYRKDNNETLFPWIRNIDNRINLLNKEYQSFNYKEYLEEEYKNALSDIDYLLNEDDENKKWRRLTNLTINYFMPNLVLRNDTQALANGLNMRVPFADIDLLEFVYNLPKEYKYQNDKEKYILREAFSEELPLEITSRKKSPYPKTFDPNYFKLVSSNLIERFNNENSILNTLFNKNEIQKIIDNPENQIPWFGQLMTSPQLLAYLIQFDQWIQHYNIDLDFIRKQDSN